MNREIQKQMTIEDGKHIGVVIAIEERTKPYKYLDVVIEFEEGKKIKAGYPDFLSSESKLGQLLARFKADVSTPGSIVDPEKVLIGKKCQFMTLKEGKYSNVIPESVKLVE